MAAVHRRRVLLGGECPQLGQFMLGLRFGSRGEIVQELHHVVGRTRHLACERTLGVVGEAEQLCCSWRKRSICSMLSLLSNFPASGSCSLARVW